MQSFKFLLSLSIFISITAYSAIPLNKLKMPPGFSISVFAEDVPNARSMAYSPQGILYVGTRRHGSVWALVDKNKDGVAERKVEIAKGLFMPNGVVWHAGDLYLAEVNRVSVFRNIDQKLDSPPKPQEIFTALPSNTHHGWKYLALGPDQRLYFGIGAPCNICLRDNKQYATISSIDLQGKNFQIFAHGVRNSVGITWHPETKDMWFSDNGRDWMGDDTPLCELNRAPKSGEHFGYPFYHAPNIPDPQFAAQKPQDLKLTAATYGLGPHVAPLGLKFYTGDMFPKKYKNQLFVAEHGSWNRKKKSGYLVSLLEIVDNKVTQKTPFIEGWLQGQKNWGRPVDVLQLPDGSLLISDDFAEVIYRVTYQAP